jgi:hypothetical protein
MERMGTQKVNRDDYCLKTIWMEEVVRLAGGVHGIRDRWVDVFATEFTTRFDNFLGGDAFQVDWDSPEWIHWINTPYDPVTIDK